MEISLQIFFRRHQHIINQNELQHNETKFLKLLDMKHDGDGYLKKSKANKNILNREVSQKSKRL